MIRRLFLVAVTLLTAIIFVGRLISLQLISSSYKLLSDGNAVIENSIHPERGYIYDRNQKSGCFAGSCLRFARYVMSGQCVDEALRLDRGTKLKP